MASIDVTSGDARNSWLCTRPSGACADAKVYGHLAITCPARFAEPLVDGFGPPVPACPYAHKFRELSAARLGTCLLYAFVPDGSPLIAVPPNRVVIALDLDGTLIRPASAAAKHCATDADFVEAIPGAFAAVRRASESAKIVIFTNQGGISRGNADAGSVCARAVAVARAIGVPLQIFVAPCFDLFRKPCFGMFLLLAALCNGGVEISAAESMFVGNAAGRDAKEAASDVEFARNIGSRFSTPEAFFGTSVHARDTSALATVAAHLLACRERRLVPTPYVHNIGPGTVPSFFLQSPVSVGTLGILGDGAVLTIEAALAARVGPVEVLLLIAPPGAGKSTLAQLFERAGGYARVNQDTLGTKPRCIAAARDALSKNQSIVIDACNASVAARADWLALADELGVTVRAFELGPTDAVVRRLSCLHLDALRAYSPFSTERRHVGSMVYSRIASSIEPVSEPGLASSRLRFAHAYCASACDACSVARAVTFGARFR